MFAASKKWGILLMLIVSFTACSHLAPIEEVQHVPLPAGPHQLSSKEIGTIIAKAAIGRGWAVTQASSNKLHAKILRHNSYTAEVDITYSKESYSITLISSENMEQANGQIVPAYNRWIKYLRDDINKALNQAVFN